MNPARRKKGGQRVRVAEERLRRSAAVGGGINRDSFSEKEGEIAKKPPRRGWPDTHRKNPL